MLSETQINKISSGDKFSSEVPTNLVRLPRKPLPIVLQTLPSLAVLSSTGNLLTPNSETVEKEGNGPFESTQSIDSPIKAAIPKKILSDLFSKSGFHVKPILEFRRKKVIKAEDKKFLQLLKARNYTQDFKEEVDVAPKVVAIRPAEESQLIKKIRKSAILRKVQNFWEHKSLHYPVVFKKLQAAGESSEFWYELHDLTKEQFHEEDGDRKSEVSHGQSLLVN